MKILLVLAALPLVIVGCGTPKTGLWKYQSGGEVYATERPEDSAIIKTDFGRMRIQPYSINEAYGFAVKVWIENTSDKPVNYKYSDFKVQNQSGEIFDALDEDAVKSAVEASVANAAVIAGGSYGMQSGVSADLWRKTKEQMLRSGTLPSKSTKTGTLFFSKNAGLGGVTFRITNLTNQEITLKFSPR